MYLGALGGLYRVLGLTSKKKVVSPRVQDWGSGLTCRPSTLKSLGPKP